MKTITHISINIFVISLSLFFVSLILIEIENNKDCNDDINCQLTKDENLKALYQINAICAIGTIIGTILLIMRLFPSSKSDNSNCQKCDKSYGFGFVYLPKEEWNVKETKVCKMCYDEIEKQITKETNGDQDA